MLLLILHGLFLFLQERRTKAYFYAYLQHDKYEASLSGTLPLSDAVEDRFYLELAEKREQYPESYRDFLEGMEERKDALLRSPLNKNKGEAFREDLEKTVRDYRGLQGVTVTPGDYFAEQAYAKAVTGILLLFVFIMLTAGILISEERSRGLFLMQKCCARGRAPLGAAKGGAVFLAGLFFLLAQEAVSLLFFGSVYGFSPGASLQSVSLFRDSVFPVSVLGGFLFLLLLRMIVILFLSSLCLFLFMLLRSEMSAQITGSLLFFGLYGWKRLFSLDSSGRVFHVISPFYLWNPQESLGTYGNIRLLGRPINGFYLAVGVILLLSVILFSVGIAWYCRVFQNRKTGFRERISQWLAGKRKKYRGGLIRFEMDKALFHQKKGLVYIVLILGLIYAGKGIYSERMYYSGEEAFYHAELKGFTEPLALQDIARLDKIRTAVDAELEEAFQSEDAALAESRIRLAEMHETALDMINAQVDRMDEKSSAEGQYLVDELEWKAVLSDRKRSGVIFLSAQLLILILTGGLFTLDKKNGMDPIIRSTACGRKPLRNARLKAAVLLSLPVILGYFWQELARWYHVDHFRTLRQSMTTLVHLENGWSGTLGAFLVTVLLIRLILFGLTVTASFLAQKSLRKEAAATSLVAVILMILTLALIMGGTSLERILLGV